MIKYVCSWVLYHVGDLVSKVMDKIGLCDTLYPIYNYCMTKSCELDVDERLWQRSKND